MGEVVSVAGLRKSFDHTVALDGLDLSVETGEVHGFLGPNGSGKSTTLRLLLGLLHRDAGQIALFGQDPWREGPALHRRLAYVPGDVTLWPSLTGGEIIDLLGRLRGGLNPTKRAALIERFDLDPTKKARAYSKGNRQKVALIAALASDAQLLLLDEPTAGLDPLMESSFRDFLANERSEGQTVLLSSHILSEVEAACDRVTIIRAGKTIESGSLTQMRHLSQTAIIADLERPVGDLNRLAGVHHIVTDGNRVECQVDPGQLEPVLQELATAGIRNLTSTPPTLEQLFLRHYVEQADSTGQAEQESA